jgi:phage terminase small subunit
MNHSGATLPALTPKQQRFVGEYLIDANATKAAVRAGYSERTANQQGPRLLEHPGIAAAIDAAKVRRSEKLEVDAEFVLQRLVEEANADLADLYNQAGDLKPIAEWPEVWRRGLVAGVEVEALFDGFGKDRKQIGYTKKIKLSDRVRRLELIGKHISVLAFKEQVEVGSLDGLADRLERLKHIRDLDEEERNVGGRDLEASSSPVSATARPALPPPAAPPSPPPVPVAPRPKLYRPIMPDPEPVSWPSACGQVVTDYDPTTQE